MGHEGPGHTVDARQAGQRLVQQHRQRTKVAARQPGVDLRELGLDQVKVVQQPFGRRTDVVPRAGLQPDVVVCFAQGNEVALDARKEVGRAPGRPGGAVRLPQAAAMLRKALGAEDFGADGWLDGTARTVQKLVKGSCFVRNQCLQGRGVPCALQRPVAKTDQQRHDHHGGHDARGDEAVDCRGRAMQGHQVSVHLWAGAQVLTQHQ